ncbi:MAG: DNA methyltransferase [Ignavibacteria bacterium]|nr:DNA methyltransferase [Ignavibacteria bacterium]
MKRTYSEKKISRELIERLKNEPKRFILFLMNQSDKTIIYVLEKLGGLKNGFNKEPLLMLLSHTNENVRMLAIKNLAKLEDINLLPTFYEFAISDDSSIVRREAVSAIGRFRNEKMIPFLVNLLKDRDPKVVLQAIRGLLVFSYKLDVKNELIKLLNHPNELIQEIINKELIGEKQKSKIQQQVEAPDFLKNIVVYGDVQEVLRYVPNESVHLTFTSPPYYNARDYSIYQSYDEYLEFLESVFKEVHRVTKEGRFFVLNTSPIIIPRLSRQHSSKRYPIPYDIHPFLIKMGWEFIDDIVWVKPEASVKNRNAGFYQHRKPLAYKPNAVTEMLMVYRKKTDKLIDWNIKQYSWEIVKKSRVLGDYETTNVWYIEPTFDKVHTAVFPLELCNRVIKFYSFVGDLVFDPFAGSGTLGRAAINLERHFFLVEKEEKFIDRIREELGKVSRLFDQDEPTRFLEINEFIKLSQGEI